MTADQLLALLGGAAVLLAFVIGIVVGVYVQALTHRCPKWTEPNPAAFEERGA